MSFEGGKKGINAYVIVTIHGQPQILAVEGFQLVKYLLGSDIATHNGPPVMKLLID